MEFIKEYELIQQTPIIHFQYNQSGATLRATEVKPKLDEFIIKKCGKEFDKSWLISGTEKALNYKMQIVAIGKPYISETSEIAIELSKTKDRDKQRELRSKLKNSINEMYFGNMVSNDCKNYEEEVRKTYKETVFWNHKDSKIVLKIICFIKELRDYIDDIIKEFFIVNNFGTRQSKGFGSFVIDGCGDPVGILSNKKYHFFYCKINSNKVGVDRAKDMLDHAKNIYALLKGGYNHTGWDENECVYKNADAYVKGYIQRQYINDIYGEDGKKIGGDKAFIKKNKKYKKGYEYPKSRKGNKVEYEKYVFVRALLGFADHYDFRDTSRIGTVKIFSLGKNGYDIERFKSPVTIKIIDNYIIFIFGDFSKICGKTFYFDTKGDESVLLEKAYDEIKATIMRENQRFYAINTPDKFDDDDKKKLIKGFVNYFNNERNKLGNFNKSINKSKDIEMKMPEYLKGETKHE